MKIKSITSQMAAFERPLCQLSTSECYLTGYLACTNTLCSIILSLYARISVHILDTGFVDVNVTVQCSIFWKIPTKSDIIGSLRLFDIPSMHQTSWLRHFIA
jgi:hypothetical protein